MCYKLYKECNEFALKLRTSSGNILYDLDILKVKTNPTIFLVIGIISYFFYVFIFPLIIYILCMDTYKKNLISKIALNFGFSEEDIYFYGLDKYIYSDEFLKGLSDNKEKSIGKIKSFFENLIYYIGPIQCALKARDALFQIDQIFDKLSKKKDEEWNKFKVERI